MSLDSTQGGGGSKDWNNVWPHDTGHERTREQLGASTNDEVKRHFYDGSYHFAVCSGTLALYLNAASFGFSTAPVLDMYLKWQNPSGSLLEHTQPPLPAVLPPLKLQNQDKNLWHFSPNKDLKKVRLCSGSDTQRPLHSTHVFEND